MRDTHQAFHNASAKMLLGIALTLGLSACAREANRVDAPPPPTSTVAAPAQSRPHPATQADCELIVDRNVEIQMTELGITDPASVEKRKTEIHNTLAADIKSCVGKRIADEQLQCIREAKTPQAIDQCLR